VNLSCVIGRKEVTQNFIVAAIHENVIIGLDFVQRFEATWDRSMGELHYGAPQENEEGYHYPEEGVRVYRVARTVLLQPG